MPNFDVSKGWIILIPPDIPGIKKAAGDLSRYIGLLAGGRAAGTLDASGPAPAEGVPIIVLNSEGGGPERNGFTWRAGPERVEIYGESGRGLCNGIYAFLAALGIIWPGPGREMLPQKSMKNAQGFPLSSAGTYEPSRYEGESPAAAPWRRFVPAGKETVKQILAKSEDFAAWAARRRFDALVFPLAAFAAGKTGRRLKQLEQFAGEYDIGIEAGGRDISSLVPRKFFFFRRDLFRMEGGRRKKAHHFCPTSPGAIKLIGSNGAKLFEAAKGAKVFHLWPDRGAETSWCSCPTCRAFSPQEQNRIAVNAAADVLAAIKPGASLTYFEKPGEGGTIPLRKSIFKMEKLPEPADPFNRLRQTGP